MKTLNFNVWCCEIIDDTSNSPSQSLKNVTRTGVQSTGKVLSCSGKIKKKQEPEWNVCPAGSDHVFPQFLGEERSEVIQQPIVIRLRYCESGLFQVNKMVTVPCSTASVYQYTRVGCVRLTRLRSSVRTWFPLTIWEKNSHLDLPHWDRCYRCGNTNSTPQTQPQPGKFLSGCARRAPSSLCLLKRFMECLRGEHQTRP